MDTPEKMLRYVFQEDAPVMEAIAHCESRFRQFEADGTTVVSYTNDHGIMQINAPTWDKKAQELGLDYKNNTFDNIKMAKHIKDVQGVKAWTTYRNGCYLKFL